MADSKTSVKEISDEELDGFFGVDGGSVMTANEEKKPDFFTRGDESFIDKLDDPEKGDDPPNPDENNQDDPPNPDENNQDDPKPDEKKDVPSTSDDGKGDDILSQLDNPDENNQNDPKPDDPNKSAGGRPSTIVSLTKKLIENGTFQPFEGDEDVSNYKSEDFEELYEMNIKKLKEDNYTTIQKQFFESLPNELQQAYVYVANGGDNLKGLLSSLAASHEIRDIDIKSESGQELAVRSYLEAKQFGTPEEIQEELNGIKDRGELEKKAKQFHPKLQAMQESVIEQQQKHADALRQQREQASQQYQQSVFEVLKEGKIGDIKLDQSRQEKLYYGLTEATYPSQRGGNTNLLGHLLEKIQWVEPNHGLLSEVLYLLDDPDGYREEIRKSAKAKSDAETQRALRSVADDKKPNSSFDTKDEPASRPRGGVKRKNNKSIFARE